MTDLVIEEMQKLSPRTIKRLANHVIGDEGLIRHRRDVADLVELFNMHGFKDSPPSGAFSMSFNPSMSFNLSEYAKDRLNYLNNDPKHRHLLKKLIERIFDSLEFVDYGQDQKIAIEDINKYLARDGLRVDITAKGTARLNGIGEMRIDAPSVADSSLPQPDLIQEQLAKCDRKLNGEDYSGAVSSARTLCEQVLLGIVRQANKDYKSNGNLPKLYKDAARLLNMGVDAHERRKDILRIMQGLISAVEGLAEASNKVGDRHGRIASPERHHAELAVNAAKSICSFLMASYELQSKNKDAA